MENKNNVENICSFPKNPNNKNQIQFIDNDKIKNLHNKNINIANTLTKDNNNVKISFNSIQNKNKHNFSNKINELSDFNTNDSSIENKKNKILLNNLFNNKDKIPSNLINNKNMMEIKSYNFKEKQTGLNNYKAYSKKLSEKENEDQNKLVNSNKKFIETEEPLINLTNMSSFYNHKSNENNSFSKNKNLIMNKNANLNLQFKSNSKEKNFINSNVYYLQNFPVYEKTQTHHTDYKKINVIENDLKYNILNKAKESSIQKGESNNNNFINKKKNYIKINNNSYISKNEILNISENSNDYQRLLREKKLDKDHNQEMYLYDKINKSSGK